MLQYTQGRFIRRDTHRKPSNKMYFAQLSPPLSVADLYERPACVVRQSQIDEADNAMPLPFSSRWKVYTYQSRLQFVIIQPHPFTVPNSSCYK